MCLPKKIFDLDSGTGMQIAKKLETTRISGIQNLPLFDDKTKNGM